MTVLPEFAEQSAKCGAQDFSNASIGAEFLPQLDGRCRAVIEEVSPEINGGRYPIKRVPGETVVVEAIVFADGHDLLSAAVKFQEADRTDWSEAVMEPVFNDRWRGVFSVSHVGECRYTVIAWVDHFKSWRNDLQKRLKAGQAVSVELIVGARLIEAAAARASGEQAQLLLSWAKEIGAEDSGSQAARSRRALDEEMASLALQFPDRRLVTVYPKELRVIVEPLLARTGAWYELFPRSCPGKAAAHGTFQDVEGQLPRIAAMGFDVLYFPPIHPIGRSFRKGKNNDSICQPEDPGSPWGIGAVEGGHKSIHPQLGSLEDFQRLVSRARELHIAIALDIAFQCSPDHPYVREHPDWFRKRPDGSIQYAENPPKKYQDIYPLDFECQDWRGLWQELKSVIDYWIGQDVHVFRVDNPHTKALGFWKWLIAEVKAANPEVIFLAEAFTRPQVMYALAKAGFSQSYNYFPWRNSQRELSDYFQELTQSSLREFFRPSLWPNTPDILPAYLQHGGRPAFMARLILAGTLGASYGIYGPAFELCVKQAREDGSEEYLDSEKYEIKNWDLSSPDNLTDLITRLNRIRRENPALQSNGRLIFHPISNDQIIAYSKATPDYENIILTVVNLDPHHVQNGWITLNVRELGIESAGSFQVHDLLTGERYLWQGERNYVQLDPHFVPAAIFQLRRRIRTERDFDYFL